MRLFLSLKLHKLWSVSIVVMMSSTVKSVIEKADKVAQQCLLFNQVQ